MLKNDNYDISSNAFAIKYYNDFVKIFDFTEDGSLICSIDSMNNVEKWFNSNYLLISLITSVPLSGIHFQIGSNLSEEVIKNNHLLMLHIYSMSYTTFLKMESVIKRKIPSNLKSQITIDQITSNDK